MDFPSMMRSLSRTAKQEAFVCLLQRIKEKKRVQSLGLHHQSTALSARCFFVFACIVWTSVLDSQPGSIKILAKSVFTRVTNEK
jgi:hypothetical protein